jgi:hypothetical protein
MCVIKIIKTVAVQCAAGLIFSVLFLSFAAAARPLQSQQPTDVTIDPDTGRGGLLVMILQLGTGEKLRFALDTGSPWTFFDKNWEPRLGQRLSTGTLSDFGVKEASSLYAAPTLYWGATRLMLDGNTVATCDCQALSDNEHLPIMGVLGMNCLRHYCLQLDFAAGKMRFLDDESFNTTNWGQAFPLHELGDGCLFINDNLVGVEGPGSLIDTGCNYDGWLVPQLFQTWTNQAVVPAAGEARSPSGKLCGETYPNISLRGVDPKRLVGGDSHLNLNGLGLHFLATDLVTLDFPRHMMYLKRIGGTSSKEGTGQASVQSQVTSAAAYLKKLLDGGRLPGWSKNEVPVSSKVRFDFNYPGSVTCGNLLKMGDTSNYHYEVFRALVDSPWKIEKAWRTDASNHLVEAYSVP